MDPILWTVLLLFTGVALLVLEFFIPSHGLLGVLAASAIIAGVVVAFTDGMLTGTIALVVTALIVPTALSLGVRLWPRTAIGKQMLIGQPDPQEEAAAPENIARRQRFALVGRFGRSKTKMLPSGAVIIDGRTYDAVSQGPPIDPRQPICVVALQGNHIVVRPATEEDLRRQPPLEAPSAPAARSAPASSASAPLAPPPGPAVAGLARGAQAHESPSQAPGALPEADAILSTPLEDLGLEPFDDFRS